MKYGVYVDWFDSVGIYISIKPTKNGFKFTLDFNDGRFSCWTNARPEARTKAIEKANEIYNKK